jgi:hypothetical protein
MYLYEAYQRWHSYPGPANGAYTHPWLWYDGNPHGGSSYTTWTTKITTRMNVPTPVRIRMWGNYDATHRNGIVYARFYNDSSAAITANALFVITQDSIYLPTPNGDIWHNHVARKYIPFVVGEQLMIPAGDSATYSQPYSIDTLWNVNQCEIVTMLQDTILMQDSAKQILQGGSIKVVSLGIEEGHNNLPITSVVIKPYPNPGIDGTNFAFSLPIGTAYKIDFFDVSGRNVKTLKGIALGTTEQVQWNFRDERNTRVNSGVYLYRFESSVINAFGKLIIK